MMLAAGSEPGYFLEADRHRRSLWAAIVAGLLAAFTVAIVLCRTPQGVSSELVLVALASAYLALASFSGATGSYFYWIRSYARPASGLGELLQSAANGWFWIPAIVLLFRKESVWAPAVAAAGAAVLAVSLRRGGPAAIDPAAVPAILEPEEQELFAQSLRRAPAEWYGPLVAVCIYGEAVVLARGWLFAGCALLALAAFAFAWARTSAAHPFRRRGAGGVGLIALRQAKSALPALVVTMLAMLTGMGHDLHMWGFGTDSAVGRSPDPQKAQSTQSRQGLGGHVSIILLTAPQKQQILFPRPAEPLLQGARLNKPLVIQFDGEYWYFQPPDSGPGPGAYVARESPLTANIHSVLRIPLLMQAHQRLGSPLPLGCCHAVEVEIENRDQTPGGMAMGMSLRDSAAPGKSLLLGVQAVQSSQGDQWRARSAPTTETLRFVIPARGGLDHNQLRQFDQIDMVIVPDQSRMQSGAKVAIRTLRLVP